MRVRVDRSADAVYVNLTDRPIKDSAEVPTASSWITMLRIGSSGLRFSMRLAVPKIH